MKASVCTLADSTFLQCPNLHWAQMQQHSARNFTKELVVQPHHFMALLIGRFLPAKMSVSDSLCSLLPPGASLTKVPCVAPVPEASVAFGGLGADAVLVVIVIEEP